MKLIATAGLRRLPYGLAEGLAKFSLSRVFLLCLN